MSSQDLVRKKVDDKITLRRVCNIGKKTPGQMSNNETNKRTKSEEG